jgi:hypothetical protein
VTPLAAATSDAARNRSVSRTRRVIIQLHLLVFLSSGQGLSLVHISAQRKHCCGIRWVLSAFQ